MPVHDLRRVHSIHAQSFKYLVRSSMYAWRLLKQVKMQLRIPAPVSQDGVQLQETIGPITCMKLGPPDNFHPDNHLKESKPKACCLVIWPTFHRFNSTITDFIFCLSCAKRLLDFASASQQTWLNHINGPIRAQFPHSMKSS